MLYLEGRTALVTGGARRIGRLICLALAEAGARVVVHYNESQRHAEATRDELRRLGAEAACVGGDLADAAAPARIVAAAVEAVGPPDILINNAALYVCGDGPREHTDEWDRLRQINLHAPLLLSRACVEALPVDRSGDIINLNDARALGAAAENNAYTATKLGLHRQTRELAVALAPRIRVNEVALGAVMPPDSPDAGYIRVTREEIPLGRFPRPDEVTDAVLFLLGNRAVTGQTVCIDGGVSASAG